MSMKDRIEARLSAELKPSALEILDESARHAHHHGGPQGGQTHYRITIVSAAFVAKTRLERHRLVYDALKSEFADGVHALALTTLAPGEA